MLVCSKASCYMGSSTVGYSRTCCVWAVPSAGRSARRYACAPGSPAGCPLQQDAAVPADQMSLAACTLCVLPRSCSLHGGALTLPPPCHCTLSTPGFHACDCSCLPLACCVLACGAPTRPAPSGTLPRNGTSGTLPSELRRCPHADGWVHCVGLPAPRHFFFTTLPFWYGR